MNRPYLPEGLNQSYRSNAAALQTPGSIQKYIHASPPFELTVERCDSRHALHGTLGGYPAVIRREDAINPKISGAEKEIAVISLVGKAVCCELTGLTSREDGTAVLELSRKSLQEKALAYLLNTLSEGDVIPAVITSLSPLGVFADIGCGVIALLPIRQISVSRIHHPWERFAARQQIFAAIDKIDREQNRFLLTHKELLGTWQENAALFREGETVIGIVRGVKSYGVFVELTPNLTGLAEPDETMQEGNRVSVLIKSILPEKHKIKLHIIAVLGAVQRPEPIHYFIESGTIASWDYHAP